MNYPAFFDEVPQLRLYDPLAHELGSFEDGYISFSYLDIVKSTGHSCPTVAGAYLMVQAALEALYDTKIPQRGNFSVAFRESQDKGANGVIASIFSQITGVAGKGGFAGIGKRFSRRNLIAYDRDIPLSVRVIRMDNNKSVDIAYNPSAIETMPALNHLLKKLSVDALGEEDGKFFRELWQNRVKEILQNKQKVLKVVIA